MTRLVKNPRLSLTTIGVLPSCRTKSNAQAKVAGEVCSPLMSSTSGIRSTGEKKCTPTKSPGRETLRARLLIGSVEVFDPSTTSGPTIGSSAPNTLAFSSAFSKTASTTKSTPARPARPAARWMRASSASLASWVVRPAWTAFASSRCA